MALPGVPDLLFFLIRFYNHCSYQEEVVELKVEMVHEIYGK